MHSIAQATPKGSDLILKWKNGVCHTYPFVFLRDCDPANFHSNGQHTLDPSTLDLAIRPISVEIINSGSAVIIHWQDTSSTFSAEWFLNKPSVTNAEITTDITLYLWDSNIKNHLQWIDYSELKNEATLHLWLSSILNTGFALLKNVPAKHGQVLEIIRLFGFPRETNYGTVFDVKSKVNPTNLAFTNRRISPHTDNPYRDPVPTLQVLHCLSASTIGGDSILVDGFKVASDFCKSHPDYFKILSSTPVTFRFRDATAWLEHMAPIIQCDSNGIVRSIRYNSRSIRTMNLPLEELAAFYEAYLCWARSVDDQQYTVSFHMNVGDLYIVDNERILHGRSGFGNETGERLLQGAYADRDGLLSKWRILNERRATKLFYL